MPAWTDFRKRLIFYGSLALLAAVGAGAWWWTGLPPREMRGVIAQAARIEPLFTPFVATSWSADHPEEFHQTLADYFDADPKRPQSLRTTIYIQPLGALSEAELGTIEAAGELLGIAYRVPVKVRPALDLKDIPPEMTRPGGANGKPQVLTSYLVDQVLRPTRPDDALALIGLTNLDLWPGEGWNFVFGIASLTQRVGVHSFARYGNPAAGGVEAERYRRRALKIALHETGHMVGLWHCVSARGCLMNGINNQKELDALGLAFCPECSAKIWWARGIEPKAWFKDLERFAQRQGLEAEAGFFGRCGGAMGER